jgi:hypothetical protein
LWGSEASASAIALTWSKPKPAPGMARVQSLAARAAPEGQSVAAGIRVPTPTLARNVRRSK